MEYRLDMRRTFLIAAAACAAMGSSTLEAVPAAELRENYQSIVERNPFGLKPIPPPATNNVAEVKEKPKTEIFLTGITSIGYPRYPKQVYFVTKEQGKKEPSFYALSEGDYQDGIKVLAIDPVQRKVRIQMDNKETMLTFETHGVSVTNAIPRPAVAGVSGAVIPSPTQIARPLPAAQSGRVTYDSNGRVTYNQGGQNTQAGVNGTAANYQGGMRQIPSRRIRGGGMNSPGVPQPGMGGDPQQPQEQQEPVDLAEEYLRMHLNRAAQERQGVQLPPLPVIE